LSGSKKHIVIICSRLDLPGGIERAIVNTANLFATKEHKVTLLIADKTADLFFQLEASVSLEILPLRFGIYGEGNAASRKLNFIKDVRKLTKYLNALLPDLVIATEYSYSIGAVLAYRRKGIPLFSWEHHHFHHLQKNRFWRFLFRKFYPKLTGVICLNEEEARLMSSIGCTTYVIPNFIQQAAQAELNAKNLITIGWLSAVKGVDQIPAIAEKVFKQFPDWHWTIIGTGDEESWLKSDIQKRDLQANVSISYPVTCQLSADYVNSAIYVMTSRLECFPMVLLEAMSHGVPVVAFNCPTGPYYIIQDKVDGLLIERNNISAMADAVMDLIANEEKRKEYGKAAYQNISRYSPDKVYALWQALFDGISSERTSE
jgi:glycosyltransferase involved in cell wall biosynthesis